MAANEGKAQRERNRRLGASVPPGRARNDERSYSACNPDYQRTPPTETTVNGVRCWNVDGSGVVEAARWAEKGMRGKPL